MMNNEKKEFTAPLLTLTLDIFDHKDNVTTSEPDWEIGSISLIPELNKDSTS